MGLHCGLAGFGGGEPELGRVRGGRSVNSARQTCQLTPSNCQLAPRNCQLGLNKHGAKLTANGTFDAATAEAVTEFQREQGLTANGKVTVETWRELVAGVGAVGGYSLPIGKSVLPRSEYDDPHHTYPAIDLPVATGTSVYAINGGTAAKIANTGGCGYGVRITARDGGVYTYCHFKQAAVASGEVKAGQLVGYSGNTGRSSGPHLHLQITRNGKLVCPQRLLLAIYDGKQVPSIGSLPTSGCSY